MIWKTSTDQSLSLWERSDARTEALAAVFTPDAPASTQTPVISDEILTPVVESAPIVGAFHTSPLSSHPIETGLIPNHPDLGGDPILDDATSIIIML